MKGIGPIPYEYDFTEPTATLEVMDALARVARANDLMGKTLREVKLALGLRHSVDLTTAASKLQAND